MLALSWNWEWLTTVHRLKPRWDCFDHLDIGLTKVLRTHTCGELNSSNTSQTVTLAGWVDTIRDHGGGKFIDLRDRYGRTQVVVSGKSAADVKAIADSLKNEYVIQVTGVVSERPEGQANPKLSTGEIELHVSELQVLNTSVTPPFLPGQKDLPGEDLRLKHRYLDLRRARMMETLQLRSRIIKANERLLRKESIRRY